MYKLLEKENIEWKSCRVDYLNSECKYIFYPESSGEHKSTTSVDDNKTVKNNAIYVDLKDSNLLIVELDSIDKLEALLLADNSRFLTRAQQIFNRVQTSSLVDTCMLEAREFNSFIDKCKYVVNIEDIVRVLSQIVHDRLVDRNDNIILIKLAYAIIYNKILKCPIDFCTMTGKLRLYFRHMSQTCNLKSKYRQGLELVSTSRYMQLVIITDSLPDSCVLVASPANLLRTPKTLNVEATATDLVKSFANVNIRKSNNKKTTNEMCTFYKGLDDPLKLDEFLVELTHLLLDTLPLEYIEKFRVWHNLTIMCHTIGQRYNVLDSMHTLFDRMSQRSIDKYDKEDNEYYWQMASKYEIRETYIYLLILNNNILNIIHPAVELDEQVTTMMSLYTFKYFKCINKLVYREEGCHYEECSELVMRRIYYNIYRVALKSSKTHTQNLIANIEARVDIVKVNVYEYKDIIPFSDYIFDLQTRKLRLYTNTDYILYDVGYEFPYARYMQSLEDYDEFVRSSTCLKHVKEMFIKDYEHDMFWQAMSENLNRKCKHDSIIIFYGSKSNGKGCIFRLNSFAFGQLDVPVGTKYLEKRASTGGEPEFYNLLYSMFATVPDFTNREMSSDRLKMTSTGDKMSFRLLYSNDYIMFTPSYATIIGCNSFPRFTVYDGGIYRRLVIIPFRVAFTQTARRQGDIFRMADPNVREGFSKNPEWRNDYIVNLIHSYYKTRIVYNCDEHLRLVNSINNRFLAYLFDRYRINDASKEELSMDTVMSEFGSYMHGLNIRMMSKERIEEILLSFDIEFSTEKNIIYGLERII